MRISECYSCEDILREAEVIFQIDGRDYEEPNVDTIISNVRERLSKKSQLNLRTYTVDSPELSESMYKSQLVMLINSVALTHSKLCGLSNIQRYECFTNLSLGNINYLGFTTKSLNAVLSTLQMKDTKSIAESEMAALKAKLGTVEICLEKRFLVVMIVAKSLGFHEVAAVIAEILCQSML